MMRSRLRGRASKTLIGLGRHLAKMADGGGEVGKTALQQALRTFHISLTHEVSLYLPHVLQLSIIVLSTIYLAVRIVEQYVGNTRLAS